MKRSGFNSSRHKAALKSGQKRLRKCSVAGCKMPAVSFTSLKGWCSTEHGALIAEQLLTKKKAQEAKAERKADRERKEELKSRGDLIAEVQVAFNAYIRERDKDKPCICCGKFFDERDTLTGGQWDAGHYLSRGSAPHLRFDERNVHRQLKGHNRPGGTTREKFRAGMIARIGLEELEALEADQASRNWTNDDLRRMKAEYIQKRKDLKARAE